MSFRAKERLGQLKSSAKARGINVNLDVNKYQLIINNGCNFCGDDLSNEKGYCLDRVDNDKGYTLDNVVGCCKICNRAKSNMNVHDFVDWIARAAEHLRKQVAEIEYLRSLGVTEEMWVEMTTKSMNERVKHLPKKRLKMVNSKNNT